MTRSNSRAATRLAGTVPQIRAIEDSIRATGKYTEGVLTMRTKHPAILLKQNSPCPVFVKVYEVYPDTDLQKRRMIGDAIGTMIDWLGGDVACVTVRFWYNYRTDRATAEIKGGDRATEKLANMIPGFKEAVTWIMTGDAEATKGKERVNSVA